MKLATFLVGVISTVIVPITAHSETMGSENVDTPQIDACRASGLIALKEQSAAVKDVSLDMDSVRVVKMNSKIGDVEIKTLVLADAYIENKKSTKPRNLICILGEKGKVLLTVFTNQ